MINLTSFQTMILNLVLLTLPLLLFLPVVIDVEGLLHDSSLGGGEDAAVHHPDVKIKMRVVSFNLSTRTKIAIVISEQRTCYLAREL